MVADTGFDLGLSLKDISLPKEDDFSRLTKAREKSFSRLEDIGLISRISSNSGQELVVLEDLNIFTKGKYHGYDKLKDKVMDKSASDVFVDFCGPVSIPQEWGGRNMPRTLFFLFKDVKVITRVEANDFSLIDGGNWNVDDTPARDLFYLPKSADEAFDLEKIRDSKYYFLLPQLCSRWLTVHPTKDEGFDSGLNGIEVAVPAMIYHDGKGFRNENGVLMVNDDRNNPSKKQPISTRWFVTNFGSKIFESQSPKGVLQKYGENLVVNNLLVEGDFKEVRGKDKRDIVPASGNWFENGIMYYVGKKMKGFNVDLLSNDMVVVTDKDGEIKMIFNPNLSEKVRFGLNPYFTNKGILVSQVPASVMKGLEVSMDKKVSLFKFNIDGKRSIEVEKLTDIVPRLRDFFDLADVDRSLRKEIKLEQAVGVLKQYEMLDPSKKELYIKLINDHGIVAFRFFSDRYTSGGLPEEALLLANSDKLKTRELLTNYMDAIDELNRINTLIKGKDEITKYYIDRLVGSFKHGAWGIIKAGALTDLDKSGEQMGLMAESFRVLAELWSGSNTAWFRDEVSPNKEAVFVIYKKKGDDSKSRFQMLFRPRDVEDDVDGRLSQARWSVTYKNSEGREISYRFDLDEFGASLDLGKFVRVKGERKMGELQELLKSVGYEHHVQTLINRATFRRPDVFAKFIESMAEMVSIDIDELKLPS